MVENMLVADPSASAMITIFTVPKPSQIILMENPYQQLLLSALALVDEADLLAHFEASNAYHDAPLIAQVNDGLEEALYTSMPDDGTLSPVQEIHHEAHPEYCVLLPLSGSLGHTIPIVSYLPLPVSDRHELKN